VPNGISSKADYKKYRSWYLARESSPQGLKKRAIRAKDRALEIKAGNLTGPHDPRTVDHKKALAKGGGGAMKNLQILTAKKNRQKYDH
jgi:5-methylcytosine-specific restriction endonuclease McrA